MQGRGQLMTEPRNPRSVRIERMSIAEAIDLMNSEDAAVARAVAAARADVCQAVERAEAERLLAGACGHVGRILEARPE